MISKFKISIIFIFFSLTISMFAITLDDNLTDWTGLNYTANVDTTNDQFLSTNHSITAVLDDSAIMSNGFFKTNNVLYGFLTVKGNFDDNSDEVYFIFYFDTVSGGDGTLDYLSNPNIQPDYKLVLWFDTSITGDFSTNVNTGIWKYSGTWTRIKQVERTVDYDGSTSLLEFGLHLEDIDKPTGTISIAVETKGIMSSQEILDVNNNTNEPAFQFDASYDFVTILSSDDSAGDQLDLDTDTPHSLPSGDILKNTLYYQGGNIYITYTMNADISVCSNDFNIYFSTSPSGDTYFDYLSDPVVYPNYILRLPFWDGGYDDSDTTSPIPGFNVWNGTAWTNMANSSNQLQGLGISFAIHGSNLNITLPNSLLDNPQGFDVVFNVGMEDPSDGAWVDDFNSDADTPILHFDLTSPLELNNVIVSSLTNVKLYFNKPLVSDYVTNIQDYSFSPSLTILTAEASGSYIILTTEPMPPGIFYNGNVSVVKSADGAFLYNLDFSFLAVSSTVTNNSIISNNQDNTIVVSNLSIYIPKGSFSEDTVTITVEFTSSTSFTVKINGNKDYNFLKNIIVLFPLDGTMQSYSVERVSSSGNEFVISKIKNHYQNLEITIYRAGDYIIHKEKEKTDNDIEYQTGIIRKLFTSIPVIPVSSGKNVSFLFIAKYGVSLDVSVVNKAGEYIEKLTDGRDLQTGDEFSVHWDGKASNNALRPGIYFIQLKMMSEMNGQKIVEKYYQPVIIAR